MIFRKHTQQLYKTFLSYTKSNFRLQLLMHWENFSELNSNIKQLKGINRRNWPILFDWAKTQNRLTIINYNYYLKYFVHPSIVIIFIRYANKQCLWNKKLLFELHNRNSQRREYGKEIMVRQQLPDAKWPFIKHVQRSDGNGIAHRDKALNT